MLLSIISHDYTHTFYIPMRYLLHVHQLSQIKAEFKKTLANILYFFREENNLFRHRVKTENIESKSSMITYYEYLKNILEKILVSYNTLQRLEDKPGDLEVIKKEISKIISFFQVLVNKIETEKFESKEFLDLKFKLEDYLNNYSFDKEIQTMAALYSEDKNRLKNIRLKILESLEDGKLKDKIEHTLEKV